MNKVLLLCAALLIWTTCMPWAVKTHSPVMAAQPTVTIDPEQSNVLIVGNTKIQLPYQWYLYQDKTTGAIRVTVQNMQTACQDPVHQKMVGLDSNGQAVCVVEGTSAK